MKYNLEIKRPEWLSHSTPQKSIDLYVQRLLPQTIAGWMIVVGCKHPLRAVYGSDLRAAWALLLDALWDRVENCWWWMRFKFFPPKDELSEMGEYEDSCTKDRSE
jgi:hypothetical protein